MFRDIDQEEKIVDESRKALLACQTKCIKLQKQVTCGLWYTSPPFLMHNTLILGVGTLYGSGQYFFVGGGVTLTNIKKLTLLCSFYLPIFSMQLEHSKKKNDTGKIQSIEIELTTVSTFYRQGYVSII